MVEINYTSGKKRKDHGGVRKCVWLSGWWGLCDLVQTPGAHYFTSLSEPVSSSADLGVVILTLWHSRSVSLHPPPATLEWVCVCWG